MRRFELTDEQYQRIEHLLLGKPTDPGATARDNRLFLDAMHRHPLARPARAVRQVRHGVPAIQPLGQEGHPDPGRGGPGRRRRPGELADRLDRDPGPPARGGGPKKGVDDDQALGRSRGGYGTKAHIAVDALGNPVRLILTGGQIADVTQGAGLVEGIGADHVVADKGYDSDALVGVIEAGGAEAVIQPRSNRKSKRDYDKHLYKDRNLVERFINRVKQCRRIATRYEKTAGNYLAFWHLASIIILLA